jgi:RND family efflux transporter MFP subunit
MNNSGPKTLCSHNNVRYYLLLCAAITIFYTFILCCMPDNSLAQGGMHKAPVVVSRVVQMDVRRPIKMVGTVFPLRESTVACEVEGFVVEFPAKRGDYVKKGQVLAKLRTTTLEIELKGAEANEHLALIKYQRAKELYEGKTIAHQELDEFETRLVAQQAVVEGIENDIGKCTIEAPFDGRITEEFTEVGQWLKKGDSVVFMLQMDSVKVRVPVPEKYIQNLSVGDESEISFQALGGMKSIGHIVHIVPQAERRARTFPVFVKIDNKDEKIKSGMFAEATFDIGSLLSATMVLKDGIVRRGGMAFVYLSVEGKVIEVSVQTGIAYKKLIQIMGDVKPGTDVIVRGNERLRNGQDIQVTGRMDSDEIED